MFSSQNQFHVRFARSRREFISEAAAGFGGLALSFLLQQDLLRADASRIVSPLDLKQAGSELARELSMDGTYR